MDISCQSCGAKLTVADEKLPRHQVATITCPKCKAKIRIDARNPDEGVRPAKAASKEASLDPDEDTRPLDLFEEGSRLGLVLDGNEANVATITSALEALSYKPVLPSSTGDAINKLRFHNVDLIFISDGFDGQNLERCPVVHYLNHLSMSMRRKIFLVLASQEFKTMDNMMAFAKSANLVVNPDDLPNLAFILKKATSENEKFYKVFMDTLKELGKD